MVTSTTRRRVPTIIIRTGTPPQSSASSSVWPLAGSPAATRLALQIGAVVSASAPARIQLDGFNDGGVRGAAAGDGRPARLPVTQRQPGDDPHRQRAARQRRGRRPLGKARRHPEAFGGGRIDGRIADENGHHRALQAMAQQRGEGDLGADAGRIAH